MPAASANERCAVHARSKCGRCIVGLDHHCVFIGSCVGAGNRRAFMVFVFWTVAGCVYVAALSSALLWRRRSEAAVVCAAFWRLFKPRRAFLVSQPRYLLQNPHSVKECSQYHQQP